MNYLTAAPVHRDEAGYTIEDGIVVDATETKGRAYDEFTRFWQRTKEDLLAEEASWAARSGPVYTIRERQSA